MSHDPLFFKWNQALVEGLQGIPIKYLLCHCIVGSHLDAHGLKAVHDVDICLILEHLDRELLLDLNARFTQLAAHLSSETVSVTVERRCGPFKPVPPPKGSHNAQLHLLIHDISTWERVVCYPGGNRWTRRNRHIKGAELASLANMTMVSTTAINRDLLVAIENISSSTAYCRTYDLSNEPVISVMCRVHLRKDQCVQMMLHAGICGFENTTDPCMGGKELHFIAPVIRDKYSRLYNRCVVLKRWLDEGVTISLNEVARIKSDVLDMLSDLVELTDGAA